MYPSLVVALTLANGPYIEIAKTTADLELDVQVIEAFEHGPVIFEVAVTNRGAKTLQLRKVTPTNWSNSIITAPASWKMRRPPVLCGGTGSGLELKPGETLTEVHRLHHDFISHFPAGDFEVTVSWPMWAWPDAQLNPLRLIAVPSKTIPVTVEPATPQDRWSLALRLQAEFAAIPPSKPEAIRSLCDKVISTPHKELIPLALQLIDRGYGYPRLNSGADVSLVRTVFRADPATAHRAFVDRLLADSPWVDASVFRVWEDAEQDPLDIWRRYLDCVTTVEDWLTPEGRKGLAPWAWEAFWVYLSESARWAAEIRHQRLPDAELRRLAGAKGFGVRERLEKTFAERLKR